ncbi:5'-nucleotidase C-terminal domain-containing protein [Rossellomorea aquimaris]|uniref:bifunctional metallophosphatase/5'-nucleotidase n=1 Tax=Rossellomorea aquimaris TaxID=189382 RepID=UPI001CD6E9B3|nr:5'-nucleotidase C-terminal domain-containing protein [Rossellomorea aquimaris]MCA1058801.1 5'-nucleotidase C-terminal domain-containing protein [Rossellomorea aquimaris]
MSYQKWILMVLLVTIYFIGSSFSSSDGEQMIPVQLLGMNDFHGQLETYRTVEGKKVGGAEYLAAYVKKMKEENDSTLLVHAGDMVGGSAPISSLKQDEPTVEFMNKIGFDVGTVGNHEFDEGVKEMQRLLNGGKHQKTGEFSGATFPYTVANVIDKKSGKPILPPYVIKKVNGIPIGFIGIVTTETKDIVLPEGIESIEFKDEVESINETVKELKGKGVQSIVVLAHVSAFSEKDGTLPSNELVDYAPLIDDEVDVIFGGHNHQYANTIVDGKLIVESYSYGTAFSDVDLKIDPETKDIVEKKATIVQTFHDGIEPDKEIQNMVRNYGKEQSALLNQVVGYSEEAFTKHKHKGGERTLGSIIADSHRQAMNADFGFMNPGGIRADIPEGELRWGQLYTMLPFGTHLVKMNLTGSQIKDVLEQQWTGNFKTILQPSGLHFTWIKDAPPGEKIVSVTDQDGTPINPDETYSVAITNYLATGGDGFSAFKKGTNVVSGPLTLDSFIAYIHHNDGALSQPDGNRIAVR